MSNRKENSPLLTKNTTSDDKNYLSSALPSRISLATSPLRDIDVVGVQGIDPNFGTDDGLNYDDKDKKQPDLTKIEDGYQKGINWDQGNITTLNEWIVECNKQQFIYEDALEKILKKSNKIKIFMLILCAIQSLLSVSNLGIGDTQNVYLVWGFKIVLTITSTLTYMCTQYTTLEKYDETIKSYTSYIDNLNSLLSDLTTTSDIKPELRPDGDKFIIEHKAAYTNIYRKCPHIDQTQWKDAIDEYNEYIRKLDSGDDDYHGRKRHAYTRYVTESVTQNQGQVVVQQSPQIIIDHPLQTTSNETKRITTKNR